MYDKLRAGTTDSGVFFALNITRTIKQKNIRDRSITGCKIPGSKQSMASMQYFGGAITAAVSNAGFNSNIRNEGKCNLPTT